MIPSYWQDALAYLTNTDEIMAGLIASYPDAVLKNQGNPFSTLTRAVVGQQISIKAANAIWQRLEAQLETISPPQLLTVGENALRQCGLSVRFVPSPIHNREFWKNLPWRKLRRNLFRLQVRLFKAIREGDRLRVKRLQKLILKSRSAT